LLEKQSKKQVDSWAICWHASVFLQNRLTLYPPTSLVQNHGSDGSGVHAGINNIFDTVLKNQSAWIFPEKVEDSEVFRKSLAEFYKRNTGHKNIFVKILRRMKRIAG